MDTWISDTQPLLSLILPFLSISQQQKWRLSGSFAKNVSDKYIAPAKWKDIVLNQQNVELCPICSRIQLTSKMFYCSICSKFICGNHVMSCNACMYDLCASCAQQCNTCACCIYS